MRTSARARLAKMPPVAIPLMTCCRKSCIDLITEVRTTNGLIALQFGARAPNRHAANLKYVRVARHLAREPRILLDQQNRDAVYLVDGADDLEDGPHDHRRKSERRLVEQHELGPHEQRTGHRQHLLLAAR